MYGLAPHQSLPPIGSTTLANTSTIGGGRTQMDTTAATLTAHTGITGQGNVTGQSDVSHMMGEALCHNAHIKIWGPNNVGKSFPIAKFQEEMIRLEKRVVKLGKRVINQTANMERAQGNGNHSEAQRYYDVVQKARADQDTARIRQQRLQLALSNCQISGYSNRSSAPPIITDLTHAPVDMPTSTVPLPPTEDLIYPTEEVVVTEVVTPAGDVVTAAVNGNGEVVGVVNGNGEVVAVSAAPTLMDGGMLSTKNIVLGLLAVGVGYTLLKRKG